MTGPWRCGIAIVVFFVSTSACLAVFGLPFVVPFSFLLSGLIAWDIGVRAALCWTVFLHIFTPMVMLHLGRGPFHMFPAARGTILAMLVVSFLTAVTIVLLVGRMRQLTRQLLRSRGSLSHLVEQLHSALDEVKELRGLVPICACCKDIRDQTGSWEKVETFVARHSHATFSHGLCPRCLQEQLKLVEKV